MITVGLVDDHKILREGVKKVIESNPEIKVILEAGNGKELLSLLKNTRHIPNVLVLDVSMPEMNGHIAIGHIREKFSSIKILVFSSFTDQNLIIDMIMKGASGYISKASDPSELLKGILEVHSHGLYVNEIIKNEHFIKSTH